MNTKTLALVFSWVVTLALAYWLGGKLSYDAGVSSASESKSLVKQTTLEKSVPREEPNPDEPLSVVEDDPMQAFSGLVDDPTNLSWDQAEAALDTLRPWEAEAALAFLMEAPPGQRRDRMMIDLLELWAEQSPVEAITYVQSIESMRMRDYATGEILESWGSSDTAAAMQWLNENSDTLPARIVNDRILSVIQGYAEADPEAAFTYSAELPMENSMQRRLRRRALEESVEVLMEQDRVSEALQMTATLPDDDTKFDVFGEIIGEWAEYDPATASRHLEMLGPEAADGARRELVRSWAEYDPVSAAEWLAELPPDTPETGRLVSDLVGRWTRYDLDASAEWLNQIPPTPEIDRAVAIYTFRSAQEDPETAMSWAESVTRNDMRERLMERVAGEWKQQDPEGFQNYLEQAELTEDQKQQLQSANPGRGYRDWRR